MNVQHVTEALNTCKMSSNQNLNKSDDKNIDDCNNEIFEILNLFNNFIISKIKKSEIIDLSNYDGSITIIRNEIEKYNNYIEDVLWKDDKYYKDKDIFRQKISDYNNIIKKYEDNSFIKFS